MPQAVSSLENLVRQILIEEANREPERADALLAVQSVFEKLNGYISKRLGPAGYRALLARALIQAAAEFPWIQTVQIGEAGALEGFSGIPKYPAPYDVVEGFTIVLICIFNLVESFIGKELTLRIVNHIRPDTLRDNGTEVQFISSESDGPH